MATKEMVKSEDGGDESCRGVATPPRYHDDSKTSAADQESWQLIGRRGSHLQPGADVKASTSLPLHSPMQS